MRRLLFATALYALLATPAAAAPTGPVAPRTAPPKTVAIVAVYGHESLQTGFTKKISHVWALDYAEAATAAILSARGYTVVPLAASAVKITQAWDDAYYNALEPAQQQLLQASGQPYKDYFAVKRRGGKMAHSTRTTLVKDYVRLQFGASNLNVDFENVGPLPASAAEIQAARGKNNPQLDSVFTNTRAFRTALGTIAKSVGADAYVIVRVLPAHVSFDNADYDYFITDGKGKKRGISGLRMLERVDVVMNAANGEQLFKGSATGISDKALPFGQVLKMSYDSADVVERQENALQQGLIDAFAKVPTAGPAVKFDTSVLADPTPEDAAILAGTMAKVKGSTTAKAKTVEDVTGTWELVSVNGNPLPYNDAHGTVFTAAVHNIKADGTFTSKWTYAVQDKNGIKEKDSNLKGDFTIEGNTVKMNAKGMLVKLILALVGNPPMEFEDDGVTAKTLFENATYTWKKK